MAAVLRRRASLAVVAALGFILLWTRIPSAQADTLTAAVSAAPTGQAIAPGCGGISFEYRALHQYPGRDPRAIDPVLLRLVAGLAPGQPPVIRIGGDSTHGSWGPEGGIIPPGGAYHPTRQGG